MPIQGNDTDLFLLDPTTHKGLNELVHKFGFDLVLKEVSDASVVAWNLVRVHKHDLGPAIASVLHSTRLDCEENYLGLIRYSSQHEILSHLSPILT